MARLELVEPVDEADWPAYLDAIARLLRPGGKAAIQYISIDDALFERYAASSDFIQAYIFPGGCLISESRFRALAEGRGLAWCDVRHFGGDYAETLRQWRSEEHTSELQSLMRISYAVLRLTKKNTYT